jgi:hypothetical protein
MSAMATVRSNPATIEVLLETTWRVADAEIARTDDLDRKLTSLATFAGLLISLIAVLGGPALRSDSVPAWLAALTLPLLLGGITALLLGVVLAVRSLMPDEYVTLGMEYVRRFPKWSEIRKPPEVVRGETMRTLIEAIARERAANEEKTRRVRLAYALLLAGLALVSLGGSTLTVWQVIA